MTSSHPLGPIRRAGSTCHLSVCPGGTTTTLIEISARERLLTPRPAGRLQRGSRLARACSGCQFRQPAFEEAPFGAVLGQFPRTSIGVTRLIRPPEPSQQLSPGRVQVAEVVQTELIDDAQAGFGAFGLS